MRIYIYECLAINKIMTHCIPKAEGSKSQIVKGLFGGIKKASLDVTTLARSYDFRKSICRRVLQKMCVKVKE